MNNAQNDLARLQTDLGYSFTDQALLIRALTHRSHGRSNNERLEYLGDSILGFVIAEALFVRFPNAPEGDLTRMRSHLVCRQTLAVQARRLAMGRCLLLGGGVLKSGDGERDTTLADALEAVIGAICMDSDLPTVKTVLLSLFAQELQQISPRNLKDYKTRLQEHLQKQGLPLPVYEVVEQSGKAHALTFTVACRADNLEVAVVAGGESRRSAEQNAARKALLLLEDYSIDGTDA